MNSKILKFSFLLLLSALLVSSAAPSFIGSYTAVASPTGPTLLGLSPSRAPAGQQVTVLGLSYREGSTVAFYQGSTEKARISLTPAAAIVTVAGSSGWMPDPSSAEFTFTVPSLVPDLYTVRLEHAAALGISDPVPFAILPVVSGVSPLTGNHLTRLEVTGTGFAKNSKQNIVRFLPDYRMETDTATESKLHFSAASLPRLPIGSYDVEVFIKSGEQFIESSYSPGARRTFVLSPHTNALTPATGQPDSQFMVAGIHYSVDPAKVRIAFYQGGIKQAEMQPGQVHLGGSLLLARVPSELAEGVYSVKVSVRDAADPSRWIESDNSFNFTVIYPPPAPAQEPVPETTPEDDQQSPDYSTEEETPAYSTEEEW